MPSLFTSGEVLDSYPEDNFHKNFISLLYPELKDKSIFGN